MDKKKKNPQNKTESDQVAKEKKKKKVEGQRIDAFELWCW